MTTEDSNKKTSELKNGLTRFIEEFSLPIGLLMFAGFVYFDFVKGKEVNDLYLVVAGLLIHGEKLVNFKKK